MPFCTQCGNTVGDADQFCGKCGNPQAKGQAGAPNAQAHAAHQATDFWRNITDHNARLLCYIPWVGWIAAIAVMATARFRGNRRVLFHAFQGLYLWVAWLLIEWVVQPMFSFGDGGWNWNLQIHVSQLLQSAVVIAWIFMLIKVHHDEDYHLPFLGELAERSLTEQPR